MITEYFSALTEKEVEDLIKELRASKDSLVMTPANTIKVVENQDLLDYTTQLVEIGLGAHNILLSGFLVGIEFADKLMDKSLEKEFKRKPQ